MKTLAIALAIVPVLAVPAAATPTPSPSVTTTATVEIVDASPRGKTTSSRIDAAVTLDRGTARVRTTSAASVYDVALAWRSDDKGTTPLFELDFDERRGKEIPTSLEVKSRLDRGKRTSLGSIVRPDGSRFELFVTLR